MVDSPYQLGRFSISTGAGFLNHQQYGFLFHYFNIAPLQKKKGRMSSPCNHPPVIKKQTHQIDLFSAKVMLFFQKGTLLWWFCRSFRSSRRGWKEINCPNELQTQGLVSGPVVGNTYSELYHFTALETSLAVKPVNNFGPFFSCLEDPFRSSEWSSFNLEEH